MFSLRSVSSRFLGLISVIWLLVFTATRLVLWLAHRGQTDAGFVDGLRLLGVGLLYDLGFLAYALLPMALYLCLVPARLWRWKGHQRLMQVMLAVSLFIMLFVAVSEWLFWDEFGVRFNFIAVDYLVYSKEVVNNILESYPIYPVLAVMALLSISAVVALRNRTQRLLAEPLPRLAERGKVFMLLSALAVVVAFSLAQDFPRGLGGNSYQRELASNGPYQFFAAFRNNELDYRQFYASLPDIQASSLLREELREPNSHFIGTDPLDIRRTIDNPGLPKQHNVMLVTIESFSASYLSAFGEQRKLTPNLDKLLGESLFFNNFYATGTRTDRGLEAITLAIPPTPGRSIVKRIGRESGYASLGQQLRAQGYDSTFIYGGRGYFDNMNAFFSGNGYRIVDQASVRDDEIHFANAWGMADEDLYQIAVRQADQQYAAGKPFFLQLMTTSNHRPYTYPDAKIDIPSGAGRHGAVKYTDYAIGEFLKSAKQKPWFDNTIFIFVADHCASSAGKEDLPVANYHIPLFIYAPKLIPARQYSGLSSQIDLAPTLLGLLNMDYTSTFFGRNVLADESRPGRAVIGNYQHLGLFDGKDLAILSPRKGMRRHDDALGLLHETQVNSRDPLLARDISYYQAASHSFSTGLLAWRAPEPMSVAAAPQP